ncbi:TPA: hypothetical protein N0F65_008284 [Lagenidium giganteum]|uniref:Intraflagellar transport protein 56 n=1 Tax=Lagenidium giganteum TaxID=4803 RepID=A0AAV2YU04_9STRA|nr:TPA: hypothetical protein N0F65_008284 [Lagenidium giganteum]
MYHSARRRHGEQSKDTSKELKKPTSQRQQLDFHNYLSNHNYAGAMAILRWNDEVVSVEEAKTTDRSLTLTPAQRRTWWFAYCCFQLCDFQAALEYYNQLLDDVGRDHESSEIPVQLVHDLDAVRLSRACCLYYARDFDEAERAVNSVRAPSPLRNRLLYLLAYHRQQPDAALLDRYQQLSASSVEDQLALAFTSVVKRNFHEAVEIYKQLLADPKATASDLYMAVRVYLAMCYFQLDFYDVSLDLLNVYLEAQPASFLARNLKACNQFRLYGGYEAERELEAFKKSYPRHPCAQDNDATDRTGARAVCNHNMVVFQEGKGALNPVTVLTPLLDVLAEAKINLAIGFLRQREYRQAFELVEDLEPEMPGELMVKAILHGVIGEQTGSKEHVFLAEKYFHVVGASPTECDTILGRQAMAAYYLLRKEYADASVYLTSIAQYLSSNDAFNWNHGLALAATGKYREAEEVLLRVGNPQLRTRYIYASWLARCYIRNQRNVGLAWELYLKLESTTDALRLLKLIGNEFYTNSEFYFAAKAFDVLERLDPDPEYWEAKRGACMGYFQQVAQSVQPFNISRNDDVLKLLANSKHHLEATDVAASVRKWLATLKG